MDVKFRGRKWRTVWVYRYFTYLDTKWALRWRATRLMVARQVLESQRLMAIGEGFATLATRQSAIVTYPWLLLVNRGPIPKGLSPGILRLFTNNVSASFYRVKKGGKSDTIARS